jgi:cytochrome c oxidase subunit 3
MSDTHAAVGHEHHFGHHWASANDEFEGAKQGMWVFMVTEVLMFGGLFVAYAIFRGLYPEMFHHAHKELNVTMGATNTIVLITSSLTMAYGVSTAQRGERKKSMMALGATIFLAGCFLVIKYFEYAHKFHDHLLPAGLLAPGVAFNPELAAVAPKAQLFFSLYFMMTGLHGIHVIIGMCLITWLIRRSARGDFTPQYFTPVELVGFYWHFVDLVWIFLFPLLYLVG